MFQYYKFQNINILSLLTLLFTFFSLDSMAAQCIKKGVVLQVLGSGGPELQQKRASSSYLIWIDGVAKVLIDAGGGSALRFGESGANVADLDIVLLTHLHADHTSDLPALIKSSYFESRRSVLPIYGPQGNQYFPSTEQFIQGLFGNEGVYRYLNEYTQRDNDSYWLEAHALVNVDSVQQVMNKGGVVVSTIEVEHGIVPALAWRVDVKGKSIVFTGDTNGNNSNLEKLAKNADLLVEHNAIPENTVGPARRLHMPPSIIGKIASNAHIKHVVLSHRMLRTLGKEQQTLEIIQEQFGGKITFSNDLDCFEI